MPAHRCSLCHDSGLDPASVAPDYQPCPECRGIVELSQETPPQLWAVPITVDGYSNAEELPHYRTDPPNEPAAEEEEEPEPDTDLWRDTGEAGT